MILGEKGLFQLVVRHLENIGQKPKSGTIEGCRLLTSLCQPTYAGVSLPTVGTAVPPQVAIKKNASGCCSLGTVYPFSSLETLSYWEPPPVDYPSFSVTSLSIMPLRPSLKAQFWKFRFLCLKGQVLYKQPKLFPQATDSTVFQPLRDRVHHGCGTPTQPSHLCGLCLSKYSLKER